MNPYHVDIQCQALLPNKMRCPNPSIAEQANDSEHRTSLCGVHFSPVVDKRGWIDLRTSKEWEDEQRSADNV